MRKVLFICPILTVVGLAVLPTTSAIMHVRGVDGNIKSQHRGDRIASGSRRQFTNTDGTAAHQPYWSTSDNDREGKIPSNVAYVTILTEDNDIGVRTLGKSIIDSGSSADFLVLLGPAVSNDTQKRLRRQGWMVRFLSDFPYTRTFQIGSRNVDKPVNELLARIALWSLTDFDRVVFLEDNMLIVENVDELFDCRGICAVMQQAELIRTSLLVLEPNAAWYEDMLMAAGTTFSYSRNFSGFLNSYLAGFEFCSLFDLENAFLQDPATDPRRGPDAVLLDHSCHRLPTRYNGDLLLVMVNAGLGMVRAENVMPDNWWKQRRARIICYEFAGLKPWNWFAAPLLPFASLWETLHAKANPGDPFPNLAGVVTIWLLFVSVGFLALRSMVSPVTGGNSVPSLRQKNVRKAPSSLSSFLGDDRRNRGSGSSSIGGGGGGEGSEGSRSKLRNVPMPWDGRRPTKASPGGYSPRGLVWSLVHLAVGYSSLALGVIVGILAVPPIASVGLSWSVFITWTCTVSGVLWSLYLAIVSRQAEQSPRADTAFAGSSALDLAHVTMTRADLAQGDSIMGEKSTMSTRFVGAVAGGGRGGGGGGRGGDVFGGRARLPSSPLAESVRSFVLLALCMAFIPSWKALSNASTLALLLGPVVAVIVLMFAGLTVQMIRLPVLWCDWCRMWTDRAGNSRAA